LPQSEKPRWHDSRFHSPTSLISGSLERRSSHCPASRWGFFKFIRFFPDIPGNPFTLFLKTEFPAQH
ncbi:hypothetical protein, partial [Ralstonia solanacearum]